MLLDFLDTLPSLGIGGLLFVMWWIERQERGRMQSGLQDALRQATQVTQINTHLLDVLRANTAAFTALREELRAHRAQQRDWLERLGTRTGVRPPRIRRPISDTAPRSSG